MEYPKILLPILRLPSQMSNVDKYRINMDHLMSIISNMLLCIPSISLSTYLWNNLEDKFLFFLSISNIVPHKGKFSDQQHNFCYSDHIVRNYLLSKAYNLEYYMTHIHHHSMITQLCRDKLCLYNKVEQNPNNFIEHSIQKSRSKLLRQQNKYDTFAALIKKNILIIGNFYKKKEANIISIVNFVIEKISFKFKFAYLYDIQLSQQYFIKKQLMTELLKKKLLASKKKALQSGNIIQLKKSDITKQGKSSKNSKVKYSWYQTPSKVGIQIPLCVINKQDLKVKFEKDRVIVDFPISTGGNFHLDLELYKEIFAARSKKIHRLDSIQIMMEKRDQNIHWICLSKDGQSIPEAEEKVEISYPSSSKNKKNWDKIGKQIDADIMKHGEDYGMDPGMQFFQEIFKNSDPDKRRAMIKSMQTSGGTVLSTDWNDVSKKDYEGKDRPSPPKGQEWKKREY